MKTKIEKGLRYLAVGIFFMALLLNVKFTLDSPYFLTGNELVAQTTGTGTGTGTETETETATTNPEPNGHVCKEDDCTVSMGIPPFTTDYEGHYWHCGNGIATDNCITSECFKDCDAYKFND